MTKIYTDLDPEPGPEVDRLLETKGHTYEGRASGAYIQRVKDGWLFVPGPGWVDDNGVEVTEEERLIYAANFVESFGGGWNWPPNSADEYEVVQS